MKQLFKYLSKPRDLFQDGFIRLSQPSVLNDPFEASFCRKSLNELASHFDDSSAVDMEFGEICFSDYVENRMHHIGVISFSENKENLLMWAHYADEHRGIVAGIASFPDHSIFQNLFRSDYFINSSLGVEFSPFDGKPKPVIYRKGLRYRNDKFDYDYSNISAEGADRILYEVFMQKSDEWIYEQEHRVILRLEQADKVIIPDVNEIVNLKVRERIKSSAYAFIDPLTNMCTVRLLDISDESERVSIAINLAKLSKNPKNIYLMKLDSSSINNCFIGLKSSAAILDVQGAHACSTGRFYVWRAKKNYEYYSLEFEEI